MADQQQDNQANQSQQNEMNTLKVPPQPLIPPQSDKSHLESEIDMNDENHDADNGQIEEKKEENDDGDFGYGE